MIKKIYIALIVTLIIFLLFVHTISIDTYRVDYLTITLLVILLLIPYLERLTKLKIGEFEAEISPNEVGRIEKRISKIKALPMRAGSGKNEKKLKQISSEIIALAKKNPELALLKLRIELEQITTRLYLTYRGYKTGKKPTFLNKVNRILETNKRRDEYSAIALEVISICNRVAHGEKIDNSTAIRVLVLGLKLLGYFYGLFDGYIEGITKWSMV